MNRETQTTESRRPPEKRPFFRRRDLWVVAVLMCVAGLALWWTLSQSTPGAVAVVSVSSAAEPYSFTVPLDVDDIVRVQDAALPVTLEIKDGAVRFIDSSCPDHNCEGFGWLHGEGEWALCAPAGVLVSVREQ